MKVDLNADMGESFGAWTMGNDTALLDIVTSANIACGFHAGDPDVMARTMALAVEKGVGIGAHPGFADLKGFGRRRLPIPAKELANAMAYQLGAAQGVARAAGGKVRHFKIHGALNNMACEDEALARTLFENALKVDPNIVIVALPGTAMEPVLTQLGCQWAAEIFADRAYNDDLTLVDRSLPGAVLHDPAEAARRMVQMVKTGQIVTASGNRIPARIDTICVHGDGPEALAIARGVRNALEGADVTLASL